MKTLILCALFALSGCETIRNHPYLTATAIAIAAGSVAASQKDQAAAGHRTIQPVTCANGACQ